MARPKRRIPTARKRRARRRASPIARRAIAQGRAQARAVFARRRRSPLARAAPGASGLVIAEGDSWFDYPFDDVLEELEGRFNFRVESVAHKGDTLEEMAYDTRQLKQLARAFEHVEGGGIPRAILLSAGGNDLAGTELAVLLNHSSSNLPPLNDNVVAGVIGERIRFGMIKIVGAVTELARQYFNRVIPVVVHGYSYPVPDGRGYLGGFWGLPGPWLEPGFRQKGYLDLEERCEIMEKLLDRFNAVIRSIPLEPGLDHVKYIDLRSLLSNELAGKAYKKSWDNELHPTRSGFRAAAQKFADLILTFPDS